MQFDLFNIESFEKEKQNKEIEAKYKIIYIDIETLLI